MAFMIPEYQHGEFVLTKAAEDFGDVGWIPAEYYEKRHHGAALDRKSGWFCQLSAPGYLDQTGWDGPFETEEDAARHIEETYQVDPVTGDDLPEEDSAC